MKKSLLAIVAGGLLVLSACQTTPPPTPAATAKAEINDEAKNALAWAESDVKDAAKVNALWTTADNALKAAKEAAAKGDSAATLKNAKTASAQAKLGLAQTKYPLVKIGD